MKYCLVFVLLLLPAPSYAYLDPASGSMIIQAIVGGIATALYVIKLKWYQIKSWIDRKKNKNNPAMQDTSATDSSEIAD